MGLGILSWTVRKRGLEPLLRGLVEYILSLMLKLSPESILCRRFWREDWRSRA